ncbi:MAG: hypothetical protein N2643_05490 [Endomicrobia bacterium]|nr:hypothetical protein [Endomicrobiia bacterium]
MAHLWSMIEGVIRKANIQLCGMEVLDILWLEMKSINFKKDACKNVTLFQLQLQWMIDFNKENFIGKVAIIREKREGIKQKLIFFTFPKEGIIKDNTYILLNNRNIGFVQHTELSLACNIGIGVGYVISEYAWVGLDFEVETLDGKKIGITTKSAPLFLTKSVKAVI